MSYLFELVTPAGAPAYVVAHAGTRDEAMARVQEQLSMDDDEEGETRIVAVHTVQ